MSRVYLDEPITTETARSGKPVAFTAQRSGDRYQVKRILSTFHAAGDARLYRLQVDAPTGTVVADVVGPQTAKPEDCGDEGGASWRLRGIWS